MSKSKWNTFIWHNCPVIENQFEFYIKNNLERRFLELFWIHWEITTFTQKVLRFDEFIKSKSKICEDNDENQRIDEDDMEDEMNIGKEKFDENEILIWKAGITS